MNETVPFGKYKGRPVADMLADAEYMAWLEAQPWFRERFAHMTKNRDADAMSRTPVHNRLQAMFLDTTYAHAFARVAAPQRAAEIEAFCADKIHEAHVRLHTALTEENERRARRRAPTPDTHPTLAYRREGRRWRGKLAIPAHAHPIVCRLYAEANAQMTTLTEIADRAGLRRCTVGQWGRRNHPRIDQIEAALNALGMRLVIVEDDR